MRRLTLRLVWLGLLALVTTSVVAQTQDIPRTPSGRPDFTGNYDISTLTPWERDPKFGDRLHYTAEEAEGLIDGAAQRLVNADMPSDPDRPAPPVGGNVGGYNYFFFDPGTAPMFIDGTYRTSILTSPDNGRMPASTPRGAVRREGLYIFWGKNSGEAWWLGAEIGPYDGPETLSIADRCIYHFEATLPARPRAYNNLKTIVQTEDHVMILTEWMHLARIIRIDSAHGPADVLARQGDSIAWWEDDTLVIETTNFLEEDWHMLTVGGNISAAQDQKVVERLSPAPDGLKYQFTVESSDFEEPYSGEVAWPKTSSKLYEYACHEGNYAMGNILRGSRLLEREAAQKGAD